MKGKKLITFIMAGLITLSAFSVTACGDNNGSSSSSSPQTQQGSSNAGNGTSSNSGSSSSSGSNTNENKYKEYSQIFQTIMTDPYYVNLIRSAENSRDLYKSKKFAPHPYGFLEDHGYDVEAIKKGEIKCETNSIVKVEEPDNLYIALNVADPTNTYYNQYMLKYTLTSREMEDYRIVHGNTGTFYKQSVFMNQEISYTRDPEIICHSKINIQTMSKMIGSFELNENFNIKYFKANRVSFIIKNINVPKASFEIFMFANCLEPMMPGYLIDEKCLANQVKMQGDIYIGPILNNAEFNFEQGYNDPNRYAAITFKPDISPAYYYESTVFN